MPTKNAPIFTVFIGLPASGKTSFWRSNRAALFAGAVRLNLDDFRNSAAKDGKVSESRAKKAFAAALEDAFAGGSDILVDGTNARKDIRAGLLESAKSKGYKCRSVYFNIQRKTCEQRNSARPDAGPCGDIKVPTVAIRVIASKMEAPDTAEGWDEMIEVGPDGKVLETAREDKSENFDAAASVMAEALAARRVYDKFAGSVCHDGADWSSGCAYKEKNELIDRLEELVERDAPDDEFIGLLDSSCKNDGFDLNYLGDDEGWSAIGYLCRYCSEPVVRHAITELHADPDVNEDGCSGGCFPILYAVSRPTGSAAELAKSHDLLRMLLSMKANPNNMDSELHTALEMACEKEDLVAYALLIAYGANPMTLLGENSDDGTIYEKFKKLPRGFWQRAFTIENAIGVNPVKFVPCDYPLNYWETFCGGGRELPDGRDVDDVLNPDVPDIAERMALAGLAPKDLDRLDAWEPPDLYDDAPEQAAASAPGNTAGAAESDKADGGQEKKDIPLTFRYIDGNFDPIYEFEKPPVKPGAKLICGGRERNPEDFTWLYNANTKQIFWEDSAHNRFVLLKEGETAPEHESDDADADFEL